MKNLEKIKYKNVIKIYDGIFIGESTSATVKIKLHRMRNF